MRRWVPHPGLTLAVALTWLILVGSLAPGQLLMALMLGLLIPGLMRRYWERGPRLRRPGALLRFLVVVGWDILTANLAVARLILSPRIAPRPAFVTLPLRLKGGLSISLLANAICLTPGTVSASLSADQGRLLIHALDLDDPEALVETLRRRYEDPLLEAFEPC